MSVVTGASFAADVPAADRPVIDRLLAEWEVETPATVDVLTGGANNRNYVVAAGGRRFALRIANALSERLAVDRGRAVQAQQDAAGAGLAPTVHQCRLPEGHLLADFLDGRTLDAESMQEPGVVALVGAALQRLHATPSTTGCVSPFSDVRQWMRLAEADGTPLPADADVLLDAVDRVEAAVEAAQLPWAFCHNDVVPQNLMLVDGEVRFVDWDYGGRSRAAFEIASFANTATLDDDQLDGLLSAYDPGASAEQRATVSVLRFVAAMREAAWSLMAAPLLAAETAAGDFSYEAWYEDNLALARENRYAADFEARLREAGEGRGRAW